MVRRIKKETWQSIHTDYIKFAFSSYQSCKSSSTEKGIYINRNVVDTIRYSYDCLEASIEFIYHMGLLDQLPITIQDNWLARNLHRKWDNLSLSDRIGMLSFAWTGKTFWRTTDQYSLFEELKRVRDGLTHPVPFGTMIEKEIIRRQELKDGVGFTESKSVGKPKQIGSKSMNFSSKVAVAEFNQNPRLLEFVDAEKALEIMLCHLSRLEETFFGIVTTWFAFHEAESNKLLSIKDLLKKINRKFRVIWEVS